ncbi:MAG: GGDEF domain-containing protein [Selenomonadaceae bacterium]|nr:GGDEF domain-containing protein [Selenomonadaceae bacterium]
MGKFASMKMKIFATFIFLSTIPLLLVILAGTESTVMSALDKAKSDGEHRTELITGRLNEIFSRNFTVLQTLAKNPMTADYLAARDEDRRRLLTVIMKQADEILADGNNTILSTADGWQILRSDNLAPVSVKERTYFQRAMWGEKSVSGGLKSLATDKMIVAVAVPVTDAQGKIVGAVQRDYNLSMLQEYVMYQDAHDNLPSDGVLFIIDGEGQLLAHSRLEVLDSLDHAAVLGYDLRANPLPGNMGSVELNTKDGRILLSYYRDSLTDWTVVSAVPHGQVTAWVYDEATKLGSFGLLLLLVVGVAAYLLAEQMTLPLSIVLESAEEVAKGKVKNDLDMRLYGGKVKNDLDMRLYGGNDEIGKMAEALRQVGSARDQYREESERDKLTCLYNKAAVERLSEARLKAMKSAERAALYIIDLDHFKEANDTHGHQYGDFILQEFAARLKKVFRDRDVVGRFGGDEFVILMMGEHMGLSVVGQKAAQVQETAREIARGGKPAGITASIGIAIAPLDGTDYNTLFKMADESLYRVKQEGRDGWCASATQVVHRWMQVKGDEV